MLHALAETIARLPVRVAIFHGNRMVGDLLRAHCSQRWGCEIVAFGGVQDECVATVRHASPDIILIGHYPPLLNGVELLGELRSFVPGAKVLFAVAQLSEFLVQRVAAQHPHAVCEEGSDEIDGILQGLMRLREGGRWLSPRFVHLHARLRSPSGTFAMRLTDREVAILRCVAHAMSDEAIANWFGLARRTVKRHRMSIAAKLNLRSSPQQLIRFGVERGFTAEPPPAGSAARKVSARPLDDPRGNASVRG